MARGNLCAIGLAILAILAEAPWSAAQYSYPPAAPPGSYPVASPPAPARINPLPARINPLPARTNPPPSYPSQQLWYGGQAGQAPYQAGPPSGFTEYQGPAQAPPQLYQPGPPYNAGPPQTAAPRLPALSSPEAFRSPAPNAAMPGAYAPAFAPRMAQLPATPAGDLEVRPPPPAAYAEENALPPVVDPNQFAVPSEAPADSPKVEFFEAGQVVAVVGDERILAGDMLGVVNQWMVANREKIPPGREDAFRRKLMEQVLEGEIQNKLVYLDFLRQIRSKGAGEDKIKEIHNKIYDQFDEKRLPEMMEKAKVTSPVELDSKMREQGTSLMKHKRQFAQKVMCQQWLKETPEVNHDPVITHAQMLDYYYAHTENYEFQAKAKWEHLMARYNKFPNKAAAWDAIAAMGNEVALGGSPLWAVAKRSSHGVTASDGGQYDWTTQGSLRSKVLDQAIFELPLKELSPILEDEDGFHIVRVLERKEAGRTSFESTQAEIKEKIKKEQVEKQITVFLEDLRKKTPVWTIFDEEKKQREEQAKAKTNSGATR